ncbi:MAG: HYR domain-containing protein, partial [Prolixibacteraceae bacterium]|nr:HYR domain-containing protein [Prolixibacteraceae bacterium]
NIYLDKMGHAEIAEDAVDDGSWDACGIQSYDININEFDCSDIGSNPVFLTVTDVNGNKTIAKAYVKVADMVLPDIHVKDITVELDENGYVHIEAEDVDDGSWDACGIKTRTLSKYEFSCEDVGENTVIFSAADGTGIGVGGTATVTVEDNTPPTVLLKEIIVALDTEGKAEISFEDIDNGTWDACGISSVNIDQISFNCSDIGEKTITVTVTDMNSNESVAETVVTIVDNMLPVANCRDFTVYLDINGFAQISADDIENGSTDNCSISSVSINKTDFTCSDTGINDIELTVVDENGNQSVCTSQLTVLDTIAPEIECTGTILYLDSNGKAELIADDVIGSMWDACGIAGIQISKTEFSTDDVGVNPIILTANDNSGNISECMTEVFVLDTGAVITPTTNNATCKDMVVYLDETGYAAISETDIVGGGVDMSEITEVSASKTEFTCEDIGENTVMLNFTDNDGNEFTCNSTVIVLDTIPPEVICHNKTVYLNEEGIVEITANDIGIDSWDACGIASVKLNLIRFDCSDIGDRLVIVKITDNNGNISKCNSIVTVLDRINPNVICKDTTLYLDANGTATLQPVDLDGGSSDNCALVNWDLNQTEFNCSNLGKNEVTLTVNDSHGNYSSCTSVVTILDTIKPVIEPVTNIELAVEPGIDSAKVEYPEINAFDNCSVVLSQLEGLGAEGIYPLGITTETWIATDASGNSAEVSFEIIVNQINAPTLNPPDDIIVEEDTTAVVVLLEGIEANPGDNVERIEVSYTDSEGNHLINSAIVDFTTGSNTASVTLLITPDMYGSEEVTIVVHDNKGRKTVRQFRITVIPVNDAPYLVFPIEDIEIIIPDSVIIPLNQFKTNYFDDIDDTQLQIELATVSGSELPGWIYLSGDTLFANPSETDTGFVSVLAMAKDIAGMAVSDTFNIYVLSNKKKNAKITNGELTEFNTRLYPNPTKGLVKIEFSKVIYKELGLSVFDNTGQVVFEKTFTRGEDITFDLSGMVSGLYFVRLESGGNLIIKKLMVDKN